MKRLEIELLLKDLEYINNEISLKKDKLNTIVTLFLDEEQEAAAQELDKKVEEQQNTQDKVDNFKEDTESESNESKSGEKDESEIDEEIVKELEREPKIDNLPSDIKTLYRKIVMTTHPDKVKVNKEYYTQLYKDATEAKNNNDKAELIYIAYKLKLDEVYNLDEDNFGSIKKRIKETEMLSKNINNNTFWVWYHTENKALKNVMTQQIKKMRT